MSFSTVVSISLVLFQICEMKDSHQYKQAIAASPSGVFAGSVLTSRRGYDIYSFRGIRFAEPPVGELRFQPPKLIENYARPVDAREDGPACPQPGDWLGETSEDCLRLNVYTRHLRTTNTSVLTPVLVYFHAGGFYSVSGQSFIEGPEYLLDHDVILVTVNYRLASLGFISTGDKWATGNLGLKDQVAALRWIQKNILSFSGDPDNVTICGYSAGSISVTLHMLSPMSKGLFHRAIAMSGATTAQWVVPGDQRHLAVKQARILGCPYSSSEEIISCLKTKEAKDLGESLSGFYEFYNDPILIWYPVVEPDLGQERFLTEDPVKLIQEGKINDVPLIIGMTELEFTGSAFTVLQNHTYSQQLDDNWNGTAPIPFLYERNTSRSAEISQELRSFYLGDRKLQFKNETAFDLGKLYGDSVIGFGVHRFANLMAQHLRSNVYYYKFSYTGSQSHFYYPGTNTPIGAVHHDDLIYLFNISRIFKPIDLTSPHSEMVDKMTTMWTNFAARGYFTRPTAGYRLTLSYERILVVHFHGDQPDWKDPNPVDDQPVLTGLDWPVLTSSERNYLQIDKDFSVQSKLFEERFQLWERLFQL